MQPDADRQITRRIRLKTGLARRIIALERLLSVCWPMIAVMFGFLALALMEIPQEIGEQFGGWVHAAILALFLAAFLYTARRAVTGYHGPSERDAGRRVEEVSGYSHRPISSFDDELATRSGSNAAGTEALWRTYRNRLAENLKDMRAGAPRPVLPYVDQFGIRSIVSLGLIIGIVVAGGTGLSRIAAALNPDLSVGPEMKPAALDLWVNPPSYTGERPVLLAKSQDGVTVAGTAQVLTVPIGSELLARVNGGLENPTMLLNQGAEDQNVPFEALSQRSHHLSFELNQSSAVDIRSGEDSLGSWTFNVTPDLRPTIEFAEALDKTERAALKFRYLAEDDYGVKEVSLTVKRRLPDDSVSDDAPIEIKFPRPRGDRKKVDERQYRDLTAHPWAGHPVRLVLTARDDRGQAGESEPLDITLPERMFIHPVARAIIEQRKRLVTEPDERKDIAQILVALAARPQHYFHDTVVFLALKSAVNRLYMNDDDASIAEVQQLLWDTALRVEDGEMSMAERELREIERQLQEALANGAPQEEIDRLFREMQKAMDKYMQALTEQMQQSDEAMQEPMELDPDQMLTREDLMEMLRQAQEMARTGSKEMAREMLNRMREMMENMRAGQMPQESPQQRAMRQMMKQLRDMARRQKGLMDETYKMHQDGSQQQRGKGKAGQEQNQSTMGEPQGGRQRGRGEAQNQSENYQGGPLSPQDLAKMQERLRRALGDFMRSLDDAMGQIPEGFGKAERSMKGASNALDRSDPGDAVGPQGDALEQLQKGAQAMRQEMRRRQQEANGQSGRDPNAQGQDEDFGNRDPLNRKNNNRGFANSDDVKVPEKSDLLRARELFDELRRRSGDRGRSRIELDYIDRLLKRF